MKNGNFSHRLQAVMRDGNLTGADLARWFDRPDPTVRGWIGGTHQLGGAQLDVAYVEAQTDKLERLLRKKQGLPVPRLTPGERIKYLKDLKSRDA
jgi:hypothetical protein